MGNRKPYRKCFTRPPKNVKPWQVYARGSRTMKRSGQVAEQRTDTVTESENNKVTDRVEHKRSLRVLSLFDGISTGYNILKNYLGLKVEAYFSSEIDPDALRVQLHNFSNEIIQIGDVLKLEEQDLDALGQINLIIGGSPCEELSRVNWRRKGLDDPSGTGVLFYEYVRCLEYFKTKSSVEGYKLFWLFENTSAMDNKTKIKISEALGVEPVARCSSAYVPMARKRLFWHNLPQSDNFMAPLTCKLSLQEYLQPYRKALTHKVGTLTTNVAAQSSGLAKGRPAEFMGKEEYLNPLDYERLLGFQSHYTDCGLTHSSRIRCLGKSWSIHVVAALLQPLADIFQK